jgi:hypothetical protein
MFEGENNLLRQPFFLFGSYFQREKFNTFKFEEVVEA